MGPNQLKGSLYSSNLPTVGSGEFDYEGSLIFRLLRNKKLWKLINSPDSYFKA
jgi:hypothetical protein